MESEQAARGMQEELDSQAEADNPNAPVTVEKFKTMLDSAFARHQQDINTSVSATVQSVLTRVLGQHHALIIKDDNPSEELKMSGIEE